ncbi:hypothetical protein N9K30_05145, partial [Planktomarina temperata]|nr:hypothetical protein [Planktomarina temperata]
MPANITMREALLRGIEAHKKADYDAAFALYKAILDVSPGQADASHNMGVLARNQGKSKAAIVFFRDAVNTNPLVEQYWLSLISCCRELEEVQEIKYTIARASLYLPSTVRLKKLINEKIKSKANLDISNDLWKKTVRILFEKKEFDAAVSNLIEVIYQDPGNVHAWYFLSICNRHLGNHFSSIINLKHCIEL